MKPSFSVIVFGVFVGYIAYTVWSFYMLFLPTPCVSSSSSCLKPYLAREPKLTLYLYATTNRESVQGAAKRKNLLGVFKHLQPDQESKIELNYTAPLRACKNGTLFVHAYLVEGDSSPEVGGWLAYQTGPLSRYAIPEASTFQLIGGGTSDPNDSTHETTKSKNSPYTVKSQPVTHLHSKVVVSVMSDLISFDRQAVPQELYRFIMLSDKYKDEYMPLLYVDEFSVRGKDLLPLNDSCGEQAITLTYRPISFGKLRLWVNMKESLKQLKSLGFTEKDVDEVKGLFVDTNLYLLLLTFFIAAFHLLFDFLAFKNDISYWRNRKSMAGLSSRTVVWRCVSTLIVFFYLMDEQTSMLVLVPAGVGSIIEIWKVFRAFKIKISWTGRLPSIEFGATNKTEKETADLDSKAMKYLSYVLYPLIFCGAIYSLLYTPHKSWYSWCVQSLVNGVYAFGFIFMLPQLFINYKMKSVAHLPWRAFMYKAFNTFIDDVFAFIITMPTAHRLACFRDDIVFLIYLYQRWLYPVDKSRINEFGQSFEDDSGTQENEKKEN